MTVAVQHDFAGQPRRFVTGSVLFKKLAEEEGLLPQPCGAGISRK